MTPRQKKLKFPKVYGSYLAYPASPRSIRVRMFRLRPDSAPLSHTTPLLRSRCAEIILQTSTLMSRIGTLGSLAPEQLSAIYRLQQIGKAIAQNNLRISTMKRINSAADDPSGLVTAARLQNQLQVLDATADNLTQATSLVDTASATAGKIVDQLAAARAIVLNVAGGTLTSSQVAGKQVELDTILRGVDTLSGTEFNGRRLVDGSSSFRTTGVDTTKIKDIEILDKQSASDVAVSINVTTTATQAANSYTGGTLGASATVTLTGPAGTGTVSLASGNTTQNITDAFNAVTYLTGVTATRIDANQVDFKSVDYGTAAKMTFSVTSGTFATISSGTTAGTNAIATINGQSVTGDGSRFTVNANQTLLSVSLDPAASGVLSSFTVTGDGLSFVIGERASSTARIGMPQLSTGFLGGVYGTLSSIMTGGTNSLTGTNAATALRILDEASRQATIGRSRVASFEKYTLQSTSSIVAKTKENVSSALQSINGTDVALESALLANNRLLQQATYQSLQMFSERGQDVLALLKATAARF